MPLHPAHTQGLARSLGGTHFSTVTFCLRVTPREGRWPGKRCLSPRAMQWGLLLENVLPSSSLLDSGSLPAGPFSLPQKQVYRYCYSSPNQCTIKEGLGKMGVSTTFHSCNKWLLNTLYLESLCYNRDEDTGHSWPPRAGCVPELGWSYSLSFMMKNQEVLFISFSLASPLLAAASILLSLPAGPSSPQAIWQNVTPFAYGLSFRRLHRGIPLSPFQFQGPRGGF